MNRLTSSKVKRPANPAGLMLLGPVSKDTPLCASWVVSIQPPSRAALSMRMICSRGSALDR